MKEYECLAVMDNLRPMLAIAAEEMIAHGTETSLRQRLFVVLEELFNNVALHAYETLPDAGPVRMRLLADEDAVHLRIEDRGVPFNLLEYEDERNFENILDMPEGGEGIFMVKSLSREVRYEWINGWNRVDAIIDGPLPS